jgi:hypothetical protein
MPQKKRGADVPGPDSSAKRFRSDTEKMGKQEPSAGLVEIDEDLHSRQLAVYGRDTMRRLFGASVLIQGLKGLGVEVGKGFSESELVRGFFKWQIVGVFPSSEFRGFC